MTESGCQHAVARFVFGSIRCGDAPADEVEVEGKVMVLCARHLPVEQLQAEPQLTS